MVTAVGLQPLIFCLLIGRASSESDQWELAFGLLRPDWSRILGVRPMGAGVRLRPPLAWWFVCLSGLLPLSGGGGLVDWLPQDFGYRISYLRFEICE